MTTNKFTRAVETFRESSGLSEREAQVYVARRIRGRKETAQWLDISPSTVDTLLDRAEKKDPQLPAVTKVEYPDHNRPDGVVEAATIWFGNGAALMYRLYDEDGRVTLREETYGADDPHSVLESFGVGGDGDSVAESALESLSEYLRSYRDDIEACRRDWPAVFEAITLHQA